MTEQRLAHRTVAEVLGRGERRGEIQDFELGEHLSSVWGGLHGGAVAAVLLLAARSAAEDRAPVSLDTRFLRGTTPGPATVSRRVLNHGRTLTNLHLELDDASGRTTATATATFAERSLLRADLQSAIPSASARYDALPLVDGMRPPIVELLDVLYTYRSDDDWLVTPLACPWSDVTDGTEELSCLVADLVQGLGAYTAVEGQGVATPNPDLSMRFTGAAAIGELTGETRSRTVGGGFVVVETRVRSAEQILAHGLSSCVLMPI